MARPNEEGSERDKMGQSEIGKYTMCVAVMLTGVGACRIRRFEKAGLLKPVRSQGRQRLYSDEDVSLVKEVAQLENEGINLRGAKAILEMRRGERK